MGKYYSKRNLPISKRISYDFWQAFKAYIKEIQEKEWFLNKFGKEDFDYYNNALFWYTDAIRVNSALLQELGEKLYPLDTMPKETTILDLVEFFFNYVCIPGDENPVNFGKARYEYTIRVNRLFDNFNIGYKLQKGMIIDLHSQTLDKVILSDSFRIPDKQTQEMLNTALDKFYGRSQEDKNLGLEKIVDVYQRISSWENKDKKKSVESILEKISAGDKGVKEIIECEFTSLWKIANTFMIRHSEVGKIPIIDKGFREYLFYAYYNCIRFILIKYGYISEGKGEEYIPDQS